MSEIELISAALATGALAGAAGVASDTVRDAHAKLCELLRTRLVGRPAARQALDSTEQNPDRWVAAIGSDLAEVGADQDADVLAAARALLEAAQSHGHRRVNITHSKGIVVGDGNRNHFTFNG
ncbi:hypothetical protein AB0C04_20845 [Micromonospora sp. NPDC048909]|uniref:hypothetical protein n=1 Tax=Micromonospora sp. NPDC048909 TaxID=3155643 RepID=UPI0033E8263B